MFVTDSVTPRISEISYGWAQDGYSSPNFPFKCNQKSKNLWEQKQHLYILASFFAVCHYIVLILNTGTGRNGCRQYWKGFITPWQVFSLPHFSFLEVRPWRRHTASQIIRACCHALAAPAAHLTHGHGGVHTLEGRGALKLVTNKRSLCNPELQPQISGCHSICQQLFPIDSYCAYIPVVYSPFVYTKLSCPLK